MILLILSFIAGILTVLAPCVLPLLPVIVGSSVSGESSKKKAFIISASLGISVILFTFILKVSTAFIAIPQETWAVISGIIIIVFGLISLFPEIWERIPFMARLSSSSNQAMSAGFSKNSIWGDVIIGASLGPVFSTCSPTYFVILATVLPQSLALGFIDLLAYAIGLSGALLLIALIGQRIVSRLGGISDTHGWFRRTLGAIFILLGLAIVFGIDKKVEASILSSGAFDITRVEQSLLRFNDHGLPSSLVVTSNDGSTQAVIPASSASLSSTSTSSNSNQSGSSMKQSSPHITSSGPKAPELVKPSGFINTGGKPITLAQFKGKVVLLDIWTYSCINCQRTLPYVEAWYEKYKDKGLVVIGLHTPEFAFEKVQSNVEDAVKRLGITYPVVLDNDYATWTAYGNQYWPRKYLINGNGQVIYDHIGEGNYDETEKQIQKALAELGDTSVSATTVAPANAISFEANKVASPETYFGSNRNEYLANGKQGATGSQTLSIPDTTEQNLLYLGGTWNFSGEYATTQSSGKIVFPYNAKNVYMVASSDTPITVTILKDGKKDKTVTISENRLYTLIEGSDYAKHTIEIDIPQAGLNAFTFTFG